MNKIESHGEASRSALVSSAAQSISFLFQEFGPPRFRFSQSIWIRELISGDLECQPSGKAVECQHSDSRVGIIILTECG